MSPILHGYFRSTASWRVRIALGLKGVEYRHSTRHLRRGEHRDAGFLEINPQGLVPTFQTADGRVMTQSLAICEYLDETIPDPPLLPSTAFERAQVRALAQIIACDVHPVQNLKILARLGALGLDDDAVTQWARRTIDEGLAAFAALLDRCPSGTFCHGDRPGLADIALIPQLGNARRFGVDLRWPRLLEIESAAAGEEAFSRARPEAQPDNE